MDRVESLDLEFEALITEGAEEPIEGWDFSWFDGRATEQRPSWGYAVLLSERLSRARSALDIQTGGGEVFAWSIERASRRPRRLAATESWPPNAALAGSRLGALGVGVVRAADDEALPFVDEAFDLVSSRHPVEVVWEEISRVLKEGRRSSPRWSESARTVSSMSTSWGHKSRMRAARPI